jgi:purine-binding chemotaxis protein CheW
VLSNVTQVPLAGREIAGVLNLRGRIVTIIDLASRLGLEGSGDAHMVTGIERASESFGILVDRVGEVLSLPDRDREPTPDLDRTMDAMATGVFRLDDKIMVALDADRALDFPLPEPIPRKEARAGRSNRLKRTLR